MNFLLDTCLLSELYKADPDPGVADWITGLEEQRLYVSVLSLGEIQKGIAKLNDGKRKRDIQTWLDQDLYRRFQGHILTLDQELALEWGILTGVSERRGRPLPVIDSLLAATAVAKNLTIVTRNVSDFEKLPVTTLNPWSNN